MGNAVIFNGNHVKTLKAGLQLSNNASVWSGNIDPSDTGFVASQGDLYISTLTDKPYRKFGAGDTDWTLLSDATNGDISETTFTALDDQATPQTVTGFAFDGASIRAFKAVCSVSRGTDHSNHELIGVQLDADWVISPSEVGDDTGISFDIDSSGQITYISTSTGDGATLKFRSWVTSI